MVVGWDGAVRLKVRATRKGLVGCYVRQVGTGFGIRQSR